MTEEENRELLRHVKAAVRFFGIGVVMMLLAVGILIPDPGALLKAAVLSVCLYCIREKAK